MVQKALDSLCEEVTGCETLAFFDLSTKMVLVTNSSTPESQDALNALCLDADALLKNGSTAMAGTREKLHLFMRADNVPTDVLCCVCTPAVDMTGMMAAAKSCLEMISDGGTADE